MPEVQKRYDSSLVLYTGLLWQFWVFCRFIEISVLLAIVLWKMSEVIFRDHIKLFIALCSMDMFREGNGIPLQYSCLENPMEGGSWWAAVHGVAKSRRQLSDFTFTFMHWRRKWQPTPVLLPGESQGRGSLVGCHLWGRTESDTTEATWQQQQQYGHFSSIVTYNPRTWNIFPFFWIIFNQKYNFHCLMCLGNDVLQLYFKFQWNSL